MTDLADRVALSVSACSRRIVLLRESGHIARRVAILDRQAMNVPTTVFAMLRTSRHSIEWLDSFRQAVVDIPRSSRFTA